MSNHLNRLAVKLKHLQEEACSIIAECDGAAQFSYDPWSKNVGNGITRVLKNGNKIIKGAINHSKVAGKLNPKISEVLGVNADEYEATGLSSIFHSKNPFVPSIHMNVRYFSFSNGLEWFGGGIDLTPIYINIEDTRYFHSVLKEICDNYNPDFYPVFKKWADDYFYLKHRDETRGVGGIFFDRQNPSETFSFDHWESFLTDLVAIYPRLFKTLVENNHHKTYSKQHAKWQKIRWGRYSEFNLIWDIGTRFGLESGGNTESILISLPPEVQWEYQFKVEENSPEQKTQKLLRKGIDWIHFENRKNNASSAVSSLSSFSS